MNDVDTQPEATGTPGSPTNSPKGIPKKWIIIGAIVVVMWLLLRTLFSPENVAERAIELSTGGEVDVEIGRDGTVTYEGQDGEQFSMSAGENVSLPDGWPSTVPIMAGSTLTYAGSMMGGAGDSGLSVAFTIDASIAEVVEYYQTTLAENGWTVDGVMTFTGNSMLTATYGYGESIAISIIAEKGETSVSLTIGQ